MYLVEPTSPIENDPNLTDKKYPGNPSKSYRYPDSLKVLGEASNWQPPLKEVKAMKENLE